MRIAIGSDHAGFTLKQTIKEHLISAGHDVEDVGTHNTDSVDYPDFAQAVATRVSAGVTSRGILVCGSGVGMAIAANKVHGIRAVVCQNAELARLSRQHNDTNVLSLGERLTLPNEALKIVDAWLAEPFEGGRHERRVAKIHSVETTSQP